MQRSERKNLTLKSNNIKIIKSVRLIMALLPVAWALFFVLSEIFSFGSTAFQLSVLVSVISALVVLLIFDYIYSSHCCRCPYCGARWSLLKYKKFRKNPFDILNGHNNYYCYNCKSDIEII